MSTDLVLSTGQYHIRNQETFAGRNAREDASLLPKKVYCPTDDAEAQLWTIEALPNGRYKLLARGSPTVELNRLLYAVLIDVEKAEEWIIKKYEQSGQYTIVKADGSGGWVAQTDLEVPQIAVRTLIIGPSHPPFFPPSQLWNFQRVAE
jgi:hypothetical protein